VRKVHSERERKGQKSGAVSVGVLSGAETKQFSVI